MARTTIPAELVAINAIQGTLIADNAITAVHIATNAVSGTLVADNAITSTHIAQNNVTATQIAQNTITVTQMADSAVETAKINNDAVTQAKIADDAVGPDQLAANAVVSASIANGTIVEADMADNAVTLAKMASLARGKIIVGDSAGDPSALAIGSNGTVLKSDGTDVSWGAAGGTTINNNANNRVITGSGTANTLEGEANLTFDGSTLDISGGGNTTLELNTGNDSGDNSRIFFADSASDTAGFINYDHQNNVMQFAANGAEKMRIDGSKAQITTTATGDETVLRIFQDSNTPSQEARITFARDCDAGTDRDVAHIAAVREGGNDTALHFFTDTSGTGSSATVKQTISADGNTIMTASRASDGCSLFVETANSADTGIAFGRNGTNNLKTGMRSASAGTSSAMFMKLSIGENSGEITNSSPQFTFYYNGNLTATGSVSSDRRLKENIVDIPDGSTALIKSLNPVSFNLIGSPVHKAGFIAQEVETVKSSLVNGGEEDEEGNETIRGVDYYGILAHAVKAIQELEARVKILEG